MPAHRRGASTVLVSVHRSGFPQRTDVCSCRGNDSRLAHCWPHTCHYRDVNNLDLPGNLHPTNLITAHCSPVQEKGTLCRHAHFIFSPAAASARQRTGRFLAASTLEGQSPVTIPPRATTGFCEPWKASPPDGSLLTAVAGGVCPRSPAPRPLPSTPPPGISSVTWSPPRRAPNPDQPWRGTLGDSRGPDSSCDKNKE